MKSESLYNRILRYYENHKGEWIPSGKVQRLVAEKTSYTPQNTGRRLRELAEDGLLEVRYVDGHAWYRFKDKEVYKTRTVEIRNGVAYEIYNTVNA